MDNRGTNFVLGFMENFQATLFSELFITTSKSLPVSVNITSPRWHTSGMHLSLTVVSGTVEQVNSSSSLRMTGSSLNLKAFSSNLQTKSLSMALIKSLFLMTHSSGFHVTPSVVNTTSLHIFPHFLVQRFWS